MLPFSGEPIEAPALEAALWALASGLAIWRGLPSPRGSRLGWSLIGGMLLLFASDKIFDLYGVVYGLGRSAATALDPEHQLRGPNAFVRDAVLIVLFLAGCFVAWRWLRNDQQFGRGKLLCLFGIALVGGIVTARLLPRLQGMVPDAVMKSVEAIAWLLVMAGVVTGNPKPPAKPRLQDGFL